MPPQLIFDIAHIDLDKVLFDKEAIRQPYEDAMKTHRLVMAANESAITGKPIKL